MFFYRRRVRLEDTDAVGILYFSNQLKFSAEAYEEFLYSRGLTLTDVIEDRDYLLPVVHAETDFSEPLKVGDALEISLWISHIGTASVHFSSEIMRGDRVVGRTKIIHVSMSKKTRSSIPLPIELLEIFRSLFAGKGVELDGNLEPREEIREPLPDLADCD